MNFFLFSEKGLILGWEAKKMNEEENETIETVRHYESKYEEICHELWKELGILQKILFRNANQHGNTVVYQYLKVITKSMKTISLDRLQLLNNCTRDCLKYTLDTKVTNTEVEKLLTALQFTQMTMDEVSKTIHYCVKSATVLQIMLAKRFFVTLYGLLYALLAKVYDCLVRLLIRFHSDYNSLLELLNVS
jgi:hypothetical protein